MKIVSLDQATKTTGYAIFEGSQLTFSGTLSSDNILGMYSSIKLLLSRESPKKVVIEEVQYQSNQHTYKVLAQLQGMIMALCVELDIELKIISASSWRSIMGIKGKKRAEQKQAAIDYFKGQYTADESEAILIGLAAIKTAEEKRNGL